MVDDAKKTKETETKQAKSQNQQEPKPQESVTLDSLFDKFKTSLHQVTGINQQYIVSVVDKLINELKEDIKDLL